MAETLAAVVGDGAQVRAALQQRRKVVQLRVADGAVQAAFALTLGVHIPHPHALGQQALTAAGVVPVFRPGRIGPQRLHDAPEMVLRVGVILLQLQRLDAGETAQHQHTRARPHQGRQTLQTGAGR